MKISALRKNIGQWLHSIYKCVAIVSLAGDILKGAGSSFLMLNVRYVSADNVISLPPEMSATPLTVKTGDIILHLRAQVSDAISFQQLFTGRCYCSWRPITARAGRKAKIADGKSGAYIFL